MVRLENSGLVMKGKKVIFLTLALLLPVAVFIFLKLFGENEFNVPVLHEDEVTGVPARCGFAYSAPYLIADSVIAHLEGNRRDSLYVFYFDASLSTAMRRIPVEFEGAPVTVLSPAALSSFKDLTMLRECVLLMKADTSVALVDHRNRIRGYYDGTDRDEVDRLIVEIKILLKEY
jgi:hypothetical protein